MLSMASEVSASGTRHHSTKGEKGLVDVIEAALDKQSKVVEVGHRELVAS